jgi:hypothetical protein
MMQVESKEWREWLSSAEREYVQQLDSKIATLEDELAWTRSMRQIYQRRAMARRYTAGKGRV